MPSTYSGPDEDGEELGAEEALHAREIGLAALVGRGDVVAIDGLGGDVVVRVDQDGVARDAATSASVTGLVRCVWAATGRTAAAKRATEAIAGNRSKGVPFKNWLSRIITGSADEMSFSAIKIKVELPLQHRSEAN